MQQTVDVTMMDVVMEIQLSGLSYFFAVVVMVIQASAAMAVAITIVYGLSFFFSSVVVAAETIMAVSNHKTC